jgi:hypothetical protein
MSCISSSLCKWNFLAYLTVWTSYNCNNLIIRHELLQNNYFCKFVTYLGKKNISTFIFLYFFVNILPVLLSILQWKQNDLPVHHTCTSELKNRNKLCNLSTSLSRCLLMHGGCLQSRITVQLNKLIWAYGANMILKIYLKLNCLVKLFE